MICPVRYFFTWRYTTLNSQSKRVRALVESAMMVALATVLSILKIVDMPYGGSVTIASMLPMIILSYRQGTVWGLGSGLVYAAMQQLLGLGTLSYFSTWQSILAVILLDYIVAFTFVGIGGVFRKIAKTQRTVLVCGAAAVSVLRYICHVISGATVWAGLSIPSNAALIYSFGYNATYMLPEAIILISVAYYLGGAVDFSREIPVRIANPHTADGTASLRLLAGLSLLLGGIVDVTLIAPCLQDEETGEFILSGLAEVSWLAVVIVTVLAVGAAVTLLLIANKGKNKNR